MSSTPSPDTTLESAIRDAAAAPSKITVDGNTAEQRPLGEMIEADRYLRSIAGVESPLRGLRISKIVPPGRV